jgi:hypothetical protein
MSINSLVRYVYVIVYTSLEKKDHLKVKNEVVSINFRSDLYDGTLESEPMRASRKFFENREEATTYAIMLCKMFNLSFVETNSFGNENIYLD